MSRQFLDGPRAPRIAKCEQNVCRRRCTPSLTFAFCSAEFKTKARETLPQLLGSVGPSNEDFRRALFKFIADFAS